MCLFHKWEYETTSFKRQRKCVKCGKAQRMVGNTWCILGIHDYSEGWVCKVCGELDYSECDTIYLEPQHIIEISLRREEIDDQEWS